MAGINREFIRNFENAHYMGGLNYYVNIFGNFFLEFPFCGWNRGVLVNVYIFLNFHCSGFVFFGVVNALKRGCIRKRYLL